MFLVFWPLFIWLFFLRIEEVQEIESHESLWMEKEGTKILNE